MYHNQSDPGPTRNKSWLHSDIAKRAIHTALQPDRVIKEATRDISDNVKRALQFTNSNSDTDETELHPSVDDQREHTFGEIDSSLLPATESIEVKAKPKQRRPHFSRTPSRVSEYSESELTSYDSSIYNPHEIRERNETEMAQNDAAIETEISNLRSQLTAATPPRDPSLALLQAVQRLEERIARMENGIREIDHAEGDHHDANRTYGRTEHDVCNRRSTPQHHMTLKEARATIPEFDGTSRHKLQDFLNSCMYAMLNINPADEESLMQAILFTKLRGKARQDFETRDISTFEELKQQLETCYLVKQSTTHLQIEFNSLKQKTSETAHAYGQRVDLLAMKLYDSMTEGDIYSSIESKRAIQQTIQKQALINFQIGLRDDLKLLVRSQRYATLQEAINGASAEERLNGPTSSKFYNNFGKMKPEIKTSRPGNTIQCFKCGRNGHLGRDCRSSKYALPKPEKLVRINAVNKHCTYCKKTGHTREECWILHGKPKTNVLKTNFKSENKTPQRERANVQQRTQKKRTRSTDSASHSSESEREEARERKPRPALEYRVTHLTDNHPPGQTCYAYNYQCGRHAQEPRTCYTIPAPLFP